MSERLKQLLRLAERSVSLHVSLITQIDCWTIVGDQAAKENNEEVFNKCCTVLEILNSRRVTYGT